MSQETLAAFLAKVQQDKALLAQCQLATAAEQVITLAAEHGCSLTADDVASLADVAAESSELNDAALETVAGGLWRLGAGYCLPSHYTPQPKPLPLKPPAGGPANPSKT